MSDEMSRRAFTGTAAAVAAGLALPGPTAHGERHRVDALLARMSVADKIAQLNMPVCLPEELLGDSPDPTGTPKDREAYVRGATVVGEKGDRLTLGPGGGFFGLVNQSLSGSVEVPHPLTPRQQAEQHNHLQRLARTTRLGVPLLQISEGTHGSLGPGSTVFPEGLALGATFDPELIGRVYRAVAREARAVGIHALSTIMAELNRDPRYGRGIWSFSEDPYLTGRIVAALVPAMQGDDLACEESVVVSLCTFPMEAPNTGGLETSPVEIGKRTFRQVHLEPWRAGFTEAGALMTEASEQTIDGLVVHGSPRYLTDLLRDELRFRGVVIGNDVRGLVREQVADTSRAAAGLALRAGVDVSLSWDEIYLDQLAAAVREGTVDEALLDRAVRRVLTLKERLGLFEDPYVDPDRAERVVNGPAHRRLALEAARSCLVLLKNEGELLPLSRDRVRTLALIGPNADDSLNLLGEYNAFPTLHPVPSIREALQELVGDDVRIVHVRGCAVTGTDTSGFAAARAAARQADVTVVVVGEQTKGGYFSPDRTDGELKDTASLDLTGVQEQLLRELHATGTPTVAVVVTGRALSLRWAAEHLPALLIAWLPGEAGGRALAQALFGDTEPTGRLPVTFPRRVGQLPMSYDQKRARAHADAYVDLPSSPLFEFGAGRGYSSFRYDRLRLTHARIGTDGTTRALVDITNTGPRAGTEVVQLYVTDNQASVSLPYIRLRGVRKVRVGPGERVTVAFDLSARRDLTLVDDRMRTVVEPGTFDIKVGSSSAHIHQRVTLTVT
ncbi:glycoside hydrolase family 3 C-terminal domain-containing protein [Streptomyces alanosinicus]|uniref:Exo-alpha-(1->6)-L-arabinopyranosidase n=1 Tax=Streptomyces alanosinicus TaxID=68171 RepID=A0A918YKS2_9ACTN|nr:glycoside hydrolase family 3 C-terminal domain-containing protein [Streptomyces alanosinicus]GHE06514.1 beta-glucosidase [Streptomyces alanosinicus]